MADIITRRSALERVLVSLTVLPASVLVGCGGAVDCSDTSGLAPADVQARTGQNYLDTSPDPAKRCDLCEQFVPPSGKGCGSCKVLKGGVSPGGSCTLFLKKS